MEVILTLATKFWQWTVVIALIIIGLIINLVDKKQIIKKELTLSTKNTHT